MQGLKLSYTNVKGMDTEMNKKYRLNCNGIQSLTLQYLDIVLVILK